MNVTVYLFGEFDIGYRQYPNDYTCAIFNNFYNQAKSTTQIAIHREGNLMFYGYVRKLEDRKYIGFCIVTNGLMLTKIEGLFSLYENTISNLVSNGQLIYFNKQGNIVPDVETLYMNYEEVDLLFESFRARLNRFEDSVQPLPPVNYGVSKNSVNNFSVEDDIEEIIKSSYTYGYTYIYKSKGYNTAQLNSYKGVLHRLNNEKIEIKERYDKLVTEHEKTVRQKKQYRFVTILFILVLGCGIGLLSLSDNLNNTKFALDNANKTINGQTSSLSSQNNQITSLETQNQALKEKYQQEQSLRVDAENILASFKGRQPFIIKSTSFNFQTGYLSFNYYGFENESLKVQVRAYNNDGAFSNTADINVQEGDHASEIYLNQSLNDKKWYSFEILVGDVILGGGRH